MHFSDPYSSDLVLTEHGRFDTDGQNNVWRSAAAITAAAALRVNDLRGSRVVKGKSGRWQEEGRPRQLPWRWITDVWPRPLHLIVKQKTVLLFLPPPFYETCFPSCLLCVSPHYHYSALWFTFLAPVFTLFTSSLLPADGKQHWAVEGRPRDNSKQRNVSPPAFFFLSVWRLQTSQSKGHELKTRDNCRNLLLRGCFSGCIHVTRGAVSRLWAEDKTVSVFVWPEQVTADRTWDPIKQDASVDEPVAGKTSLANSS